MSLDHVDVFPDALPLVVDLAETAALSRLTRDVRRLQPAGGAGTVAPGCEHHDSTWMGGYLAGVCAALALFTHQQSSDLEAQALAVAEVLR